MIPGLRMNSYKERLRRLKLWSLEERRNRIDLIKVLQSSRDLNGIDFSLIALLEMSPPRTLSEDERERGFQDSCKDNGAY